MSLESGTYVSDLVATNPTGTDPKSQGDDHLRLIKSTLKNTFPNATGPQPTMAFCKNKLFNGEVTRINQREFDGNWATKNIWASGNTIAQQEACYGYDMWAKASATDMVQPIEAGNFRPSTVHTLSGIGVTTQQITSPASGNWVITVPQTARNVQVEEGVEATPFEIRPTGFELAQCQRYLRKADNAILGAAANAGSMVGSVVFGTPMRATPDVTTPNAPITISDGVVDYVQSTAQVSVSLATAAGSTVVMTNFSGLTTHRPLWTRGVAFFNFSAVI